jgi:hypothetical protein
MKHLATKSGIEKVQGVASDFDCGWSIVQLLADLSVRSMVTSDRNATSSCEVTTPVCRSQRDRSRAQDLDFFKS